MLAQEFLATYGKIDAEPQLVPRGQRWGGIYFTLFARNVDARFKAPKEVETEEAFRLRSSEGRAVDAYYDDSVQRQLKEDELTMRALVGAEA